MEYPVKTVCVVGLGYIGLPTAATLASRGIDVVGVDINPRVVEAVNAGRCYFAEPDLDMLLRAATTLGKLRAADHPEPADAFVIAVPTPFHEDRSPNLDYIDLAADAIAPVLVSGNVVILESTSPVGTTKRLAARLARGRPDLRFPPARHSEPLDVHVAHCPERVLPGRMVRELIENDRIIGGITEACAEHAEAVYRVFLQGQAFRTDASTAESLNSLRMPRAMSISLSPTSFPWSAISLTSMCGRSSNSPTAIHASRSCSRDLVWVAIA